MNTCDQDLRNRAERERRNGEPPHVVVVGGGIAGLAAAAFLTGAAQGDGAAGTANAAGAFAPGARVTLLEASTRLGGKLRTGEVGGIGVDVGAEALLALRPEAVELARAVGLAAELEPTATTRTAVWTRGALRPLPEGQLMGIPGDLDALAACGVLSAAGLARARMDLRLPRTEVGDDVAIGEYVAARVGREVVDRLVEPLLGGVYAGRADRISLRAALPQLLPVAQGERSLVAGVRLLQRAHGAPPHSPRPVFQGIRGGVGRLAGAVADACRTAGVELRTGTVVHGLRRTGHGWRLAATDSGGTRELNADAVVLAVPATMAARLLAAAAPGASAELDAVEYASTALVTMAFRRCDVPSALAGSGFVVPPVDGRTVKACTLSTAKWHWLDAAAPDAFVLRTSVGRYGDEDELGLADEELVERSLADLKDAAGLCAAPYATEVTRWVDGLPQYPVGHLARVARIREYTGRLGALELCGAAYDGVGIPACIASARRAAEAVAQAI